MALFDHIQQPQPPATIHHTWDEIEKAVHGVLETWSNETLLFLAGDNVNEVNGLISDKARDILAKREVDYH